jgi:hypothetical protein
MRLPRLLRFAIPALALCAPFACKNNDTTTSPGAVASITVNAPDTAKSGQSFTIDVNATNVGVQGVHNGMVAITVTAPLTVTAVDPSAGTTATFTSGGVTWNLGTLDSNSNSTLHITVVGTLPNGSAGQMLTVQATLTADGIRAGDAVAQDTLQLNP